MFNVIKVATAKQFDRMRKYGLFRVQVDKDLLWETYLNSFPEGSNPIYKERTEHDCQCCKQFIRTVGNVVAIIDGELESIWSIKIDSEPYQIVANYLSALVKSCPIDNVFFHTENTAGTDKNFQQILDQVKTWEHFFVNVPKENVLKGLEIGPKLSDFKATHDVLLRSLEEITDESLDTVLELIAQNSLYRGQEHQFAVNAFMKLKKKFDKLQTIRGKDDFVWSLVKGTQQSVSRIRSTVIGTLLVDISEGKEMDAAVASFESKVAPTNYKRPTAIVTKAMIELAKNKIEEMGLTSALERRYATIADITVSNIMFANRDARKKMSGNVFDEIAGQVSEKTKNLDKVEEVSIEKFIIDILPNVNSIEVVFENRHTGNLVSLVAPVDPTAGGLFKWPNNFSWSYNGELADSIKERVKKAGGNVSGDFCNRLAWYNYDDLDFHMKEPNGHEIYFGRKGPSPCNGYLDVDMNAGQGTTREPVENIFYQDKRHMKEGKYLLLVHNYCRRESAHVGFEVETDFMGTIHRFAYDKGVKSNETIPVAEFKYSHAKGIEIIKSLPSSQSVREVWGIPTQTFHKVNVLMLSPNYWDDKTVGNKHFFFMIDGCLNDGKARGFFNEFLKSEFDANRKVFEIVGSKMKTEESNNQLSGLGFSSTQRNNVLCRVKGSFSRTIKINF
jgi:hypothetical protein